MVLLWGACEFYYFTQKKKTKQPQLTTITLTTDVRAYCAKKCCVPIERWCDGIFANGDKAEGLAIASSVLPFGTIGNVPGYGVAVVKDHGAHLVEVFFEKHENAVNWGVKRNMQVEVFQK